MANEADTCRKYVLPRLYKSGWTDDQINEQRYFTDGRIVTLGKGHYRKPGKKVDYLLRFKPHFPLAVAEIPKPFGGPDKPRKALNEPQEMLYEE
ncbi:MAG: hypothetical protein ABSA12_15130 [Verrucomicrobiia bacterium]